MNYTKEQVAEWKKKHGEIFELSVEDKSCILRRPNRQDLSYVSVVKDPIKMSETLMKQLWVDGDKESRSVMTCSWLLSPKWKRSSK